MGTTKISKERESTGNKMKAVLIFFMAVSAAAGLVLYAFYSGNIGFSVILMIFAAILVVAFGLFAMKRYSDAGKGIPFEDERSKRVMEKAASGSFFATMYVLLAIGWLSDVIKFRDVSQATGAVIGIMALLFASFWVYYNRKGI